MAFDTVPWIIDGTTVDAEVIRRAVSTLVGPKGGIVSSGDLAVSQNGTPNMSVNIGTGEIWVPGTSTATQGMYYGRNGATVNQPISASNPTNPRVDTIVAQVQDAEYAGSAKQLAPGYIVGTPTAGVVTPPTTAAQASTDGAGTVPASSYVLAYVLVPANATSIVTADIANVAARATLGNLGAQTDAAPALLLQGSGLSSGQSSGDYIFTEGGGCLANSGVSTVPIPMWVADSEWQSPVSGKSAWGILRTSLVTNSVAPGASFAGGLYRLSALDSSTGGSIQYTYTRSQQTPTITNPSAATFYSAVSPAFLLPADSTGYSLGVDISGTPVANATVAVTTQLYVYWA